MSGSESSSRRPIVLAAVATGVALGALNLVVAYVIARAAGMQAIELPPAILWGLVLLGVATAITAVVQWRAYARANRLDRSRRTGV